MADRNNSNTIQKENNAVCGRIREDRSIHSGDLFLHFKNKMYQIVTTAVHSETEETLVIYQALYGDYKVYARPLEMFLSEVDHEKYPEIVQKYRFEKIERNFSAESSNTEEPIEAESAADMEESMEVEPTVDMEVAMEAGPTTDTEELAEAGPTDAEQPNKWLMKFLCADTYDEKSALLKDMEGEMTDRLVNNLAAALDVVIPEGPIAERYRQLRICVDTKKRYETGRLR